MSKYIILAVTIAFFVSFTIIFSMFYLSQDTRTLQDLHTHPFFLSKLNSEKISIFLIGHSHVGQLNTIKINQVISEKYDDVDVYNLAMYHDTPSERLKQIDDIINSHPKIIFYGIAIADFLGPCKYSNDCNLSKTNEEKFPEKPSRINFRVVNFGFICSNPNFLAISRFLKKSFGSGSFASFVLLKLQSLEYLQGPKKSAIGIP